MRRKISYNLRFLFLQLDFESNSPDDEVLIAAKYVQQIFNANKTLQQVTLEDLPQAFIPKHLKKYILKADDAVVRYEMLLYQSLRNSIEAGDVFMKESLNFKGLEEDLIPLKYWQKNQQNIIESIGLSKLSIPMNELLAYWKNKIDALYKKVNMATKEGNNPSVKIHGTQTYVLDVAKWTCDSTSPVHFVKLIKRLKLLLRL